MSGGFEHFDWNPTLPPAGEEWSRRDEFNALSDRSLAEQLRLLRHAGPLEDGDVVLICLVRNEALRLPTFFAHYKRLGVKRFFMVDNASEDGTLDLLQAEPTATVFHTSASYRDSCCGIYWINGIARAHCVGHWTLLADADELLVYDGHDKRDLPALGEWLAGNSLDRLFALMIDVYPPGVIGETGLSIDENLHESWFDTTGYALQRHRGGWLATGGPRQRLFGKNPLAHGEWTSKHPFFFMTPETVVFNAHFVWPRDAEPARPMGALIHLKFMDDFAERAARNEREGQHYNNAMKYRIINEALFGQPRQIAHYPRSAKYSGPESLIRHNLLLPIDWDRQEASPLPHRRSLGDIDFRVWSAMGNSEKISPSERAEFEDFSRRAFAAHLSVVRCRGHLAPGEIGLVSVLRNEAVRLPLFIDHYKRLGVARFFMIDNNSDDGTRDMLLAEPSADIFHAHASFREGQAGLYWAQAVARLYGEGNWLIRPDGDELFVYDGMEEHDLRALAYWLERQGMDRVFAPMVDLYPSSALEQSNRTIEDLIANDGWFDNDGYELEGWQQGWYLTGGPRDRVFSRDGRTFRTPIGKYPFFHMTADTLIYNHHWLWPHDKVTRSALGALVHLKFMQDFIERSARYEREGQHWNHSKVYRHMNERMRETRETVLFYEGSRRYRGPRSLMRHGMLMPIDWDA